MLDSCLGVKAGAANVFHVPQMWQNRVDMLIIFDVRDDQLDMSQWTDLATKSPLWTLCSEWRAIPMAHLEPIPTDEEKKINGEEVTGDDLPD